MKNRADRAQIAAETLTILKSGSYTSPTGRLVSISDAVTHAVGNTKLIPPGEHGAVEIKAHEAVASRNFRTRFEVQNETTFSAARRLVARYGPGHVAALNFASAKNPGGGFLSGSQAQEESLARASALYACLEQQPRYYEANRRSSSLLYTDHLIVSPRVPVFRNDDDLLLEEPWEVSIITAPAPNAAAIAKTQPVNVESIEPTFRRRIAQVLAAAAAFDQTALVLGAWGCGVFGNDPAMVARRFAEFLLGGGSFASAFEHVVFGILDRRGDTIEPFKEVFDRPELAT